LSGPSSRLVRTQFGPRNSIRFDDYYRLDVRPDGTVELNRDVENWMPLLPSFGIDWRF